MNAMDGKSVDKDIPADDTSAIQAAGNPPAGMGSAPAGGAAHAHVLIALSGGVDSSVVAYLLTQAGYTCTGATMHLFDAAPVETPDSPSNPIADARAICDRLHIPHEVLDLSATFTQQVIDPFIATYEHGWTPNPCVQCNRHLKFGSLVDYALATGHNHIATGHYARISYDKNAARYLLKRALDPQKDQSYVLYTLTQQQLAHTLFPLGELTKEQVRQIALEQGFPCAHKGESQDICFIPNHDHEAFIRRSTGREYPPGDIVDVQGRHLGTHPGIIGFTVGQRKGIGIAAPQPLYVKEIIPQTGTLVVGPEDCLYGRVAIVEDINLIARESLEGPIKATAKQRYRSPEQPVTVRQVAADRLEVVFDEPQKAITKGQSLVIYNGDTVLGGGTITAVG